MANTPSSEEGDRIFRQHTPEILELIVWAHQFGVSAYEEGGGHIARLVAFVKEQNPSNWRTVLERMRIRLARERLYPFQLIAIYNYIQLLKQERMKESPNEQYIKHDGESLARLRAARKEGKPTWIASLGDSRLPEWCNIAGPTRCEELMRKRWGYLKRKLAPEHLPQRMGERWFMTPHGFERIQFLPPKGPPKPRRPPRRPR